MPTAKADTNLQYFDRGSACNTGVLAMNQNFKPFDNPKIRQAVGYAINRQAIVDAFFGDTGVVLKNWAPPGTIFANDLAVPDYDPEKAKALIAESGVTDLAFDFWYPSDVSRPYMPDPKGEFEAILRDLEAVGFKPNPKTSPWRPDYLAAESRGDYPVFLIGWNCDWLGIDNFLYTAFFGYRGDPLAPNPEYAYKNDAMNDAMVAALGVLGRGDPAGRVDQGPGPHRRRHAVGADRLGQDPGGRRRPTSRASSPRRRCSSCSRTSGSTSSRDRLTGASGARQPTAGPPAALPPGDPRRPISRIQ